MEFYFKDEKVFFLFPKEIFPLFSSHSDVLLHLCVYKCLIKRWLDSTFHEGS